MTHGLSNGFLYTAKRIITIWDTAKGTVENAGTGFFIQKEDTLYLITNRLYNFSSSSNQDIVSF